MPISLLGEKSGQIGLRGHADDVYIPSTYHLNFDGVDDLITIPASPSLNNLAYGDFTVESVTKVVSNGAFDDLPYGALFCKMDNNVGWQWSIVNEGASWRYSAVEMYCDPNGDDYFYYDAPDTYELAEVNDGQFHHFEANYFSSTKTVKIFVDGVLQVNGDYTKLGDFQANGFTGDDSAGDLTIGKLWYTPYYWHKGSDRWFRISNVARHSSSFTHPSLTTCPAADANTVLLLALNEGTGTTVTDTSGNNNNGTITGATWEID
jgi:hypothetical protein